MADWNEFFQGLAGGAMGITKGLTAGMEPFNAWEKVRTQDLANDKTDIQLRDLGLLQDTREAFPNYYGNVVGAADMGNQLSIGKGQRDLFGIGQDLSMNEYLASPGFQDIVARLDPSDPEYRVKLAAAIAQYNPQAGVAAYDKANIPGMQQRNLAQQAVGRYIESYAQREDPGAVLQWNEDGTASVIHSDGTVVQVPPDLLVRAAAMMSDKNNNPYTAVSQGVKDETSIQAGNANLYKAVQSGAVLSPTQLRALTEQRQQIKDQLKPINDEMVALRRDVVYQMAPPEVRAQMEAQIRQKAAPLLQQLERLNQQTKNFAAQGVVPMGTGGPRVAPAGGSSVTTARPPIGTLIQGAAGVAPGRPAPYRAEGPRNTGIRPIGGAPQDTMGDQQWMIDLLNQAFGDQLP
jgi:hypothetical protein